MSDDLSQFHAVFFEEAREHLEDVENQLLAMDLDSADQEALNAIFRAAHSIKGSSGVFGFRQVAAFTHHLETMLDRLRNHELVMEQHIVDLVLESVDVIRAMTGALEAGDDPDIDANDLESRLAAASGKAEPAEETLPEEDGFGLFTDNVPDDSSDDEGFGLFTDEADEQPEDEGFGLFEDNLPTEGKPAAAQQASEDYFNEFFAESPAERPAPEPEPEPESSATSTATPAQSDAGKGPGYGIFPGSPGSDQSPQKATKPAEPEKKKANGGGEASSIRVSVDKVDQLINLVGELVITQSMLMQTGKTLDPSEHEHHLNTLSTLERHTRDLQDGVMSIRLMPVSFLFNRFPRVVRDMARKMDKDIDLQMLGEQTELDKTIIERLTDPMMHLVRNAIDHGIESPDKREAAGKSRKGQVILSAAHEGGNILIEISDDGGGLNRDAILKKAAANNLPLQDNMSDGDVWQLIFMPGFSTAEAITDVSGRGVGMDVVRRNIVDLGGRIDIQSVEGQGSKFSIRLPLTLAILDGMILSIQDEVFVLPLASVVESFRIEPGLVKGLQGEQRVIPMRGNYIPLLDLSTDLNLGAPMRQEESVAVVVESEGRQVAIMVNDLLGQQQVVIKSIEANYRKLPGFSGATIMGDGSVALILDVSYLVHKPEAATP